MNDLLKRLYYNDVEMSIEKDYLGRAMTIKFCKNRLRRIFRIDSCNFNSLKYKPAEVLSRVLDNFLKECEKWEDENNA